MEFKAIETTVNGMTYRSRTEAAWAVYFRLIGMRPIYEPGVVDVWFLGDPRERVLGSWLPDFRVTCNCKRKGYPKHEGCWWVHGEPDVDENGEFYLDKSRAGRETTREQWGHVDEMFVEIKPMFNGDISNRNRESIGKAIVSGYHRSTLLVFGTPLEYKAVIVCGRHKGNPEIQPVRFFWEHFKGDIYRCGVEGIGDSEVICDFYPDESGLDHVPESISQFSTSCVYSDCPLANRAWSATQKKWGAG